MPPPRVKAKTTSYDEARAQLPWVQALCIGVDEYEYPNLPKLTNAVRDAISIAEKIQGKKHAVLVNLLCHASSLTGLQSRVQPSIPRAFTLQTQHTVVRRHI